MNEPNPTPINARTRTRTAVEPLPIIVPTARTRTRVHATVTGILHGPTENVQSIPRARSREFHIQPQGDLFVQCDQVQGGEPRIDYTPAWPNQEHSPDWQEGCLSNFPRGWVRFITDNSLTFADFQADHSCWYENESLPSKRATFEALLFQRRRRNAARAKYAPKI